MPDEVISDTSPLQYLHQADCLAILPDLYGTIIVPEGVARELAVGTERGVSLPDVDRLDWIRIKAAPHQQVLPMAADLGQGEREVLSLAIGKSDVLALLDDGLARHFAKYLEVPFTGTLGVLVKAKVEGLIEEVAPVVDCLQLLGFRLDSNTRQAVLELAREA